MRVSIITINLNNRNGLQKTIDSVVSQSFKDFEWIVIDGGSSDGSRELIERYAEHFAYWASEPDGGVYNAMNKGIKEARGEYLLMLNSGDCLVEDGTVETVVRYLDGTDVVQGNVLEVQKGKWKKNRGYGKSDLTFRDVYQGHFLHQASFIRKDLHDKYGLYEESWHIAGDTVFFLKALGFGDATFKYIDVDVSRMEPYGISSYSSPKWNSIRCEEDEKYDALLSPRLLKMCHEEEKKVALYDELYSCRPIWCCVMLLKKIAGWFCKKNK